MVASSDLSHRFEAESVGRALELVGERWTLLILREAFFGVRRFGQLARNLNIPRPTLSSRLRMLVDAGLLELRLGPAAGVLEDAVGLALGS